MRVINSSSRVSNQTIQAFINDLGMSSSKYTLIIEDEQGDRLGHCTRSGSTITIYLGDDAHMGVLAHEMKHAEQHMSGLSVWMRAESELVESKQDRWHEIEAIEYAREWDGQELK